MRVFKTVYRDRNGKKRTAVKFYVEIRDHGGVARRLPAFIDKRASEEFGRKLKRLAQLRGAGELLCNASRRLPWRLTPLGPAGFEPATDRL